MLRQEAPECEACKEGASPISNPSLPTVGNPIALDGGAKVQSEVNYATADGMMSVSREYRSRGAFPTTDLPGFGEKWRGILPGRLETFGNGIDQIKYLSSGGSITTFDFANDWSFTTADATRLTLSMVTTPSVDRFTYFHDQASIPNGDGEVKLSYANGDYILFRRANYDQGEKVRYLVPIERGSANGYRLWYDYSDDSQYPFKVRDSLNREMGLTWADVVWSGSQSIVPKTKAISDIVLPDATTLHHVYGFSAPATTDSWKDRLESVQRLSSAGNVLWARTYHYEDPRFAYALTGTSDQNGARLSTYSYDAAGRATSTELAGGVNRETVGYFIDTSDDSLDIRRVVNALGHQTEYTFSRPLYDEQMTPRKLTRIFEPASGSIPERSVTHTYDTDGLVIGKTDANGNVSGQENDIAGKRPTSSTDAAGVVTTLQWHPTLDLVLQEARPGLTVDYGYDGAGQLLSRTETDTTTQTLPYATNGQTRTTSYVWGGNGRLLSMNGPRPINGQGQDDITSFTYDAQGNRLTMANALGHITSFATYDANGRPGEMTDPNGVKTLYGYDELGRVNALTVKHPSNAALDAVTAITYDVEGRVTGVTRPETAKLNFDYDLAGRMLSVRSDDGERIDYTYDAMGNVLSETARRADGVQSRATTRTFDALGRLLTETLGVGRTTDWAYDKNGNATQITSPRGNAMAQAFDALNRLISVAAPAAGTTTTTYDARDNVTDFTDAHVVNTKFIHNGFGDVIQEISPDRGTSTYTYDPAGDLLSAVDGRGQQIDYTRDILGRVLQKRPVGQPANENIDYVWDVPGITGSRGIGRMARVTDATGITKWSYDHRGNMVTQQQKLLGTVDWVSLRYAYDLSDRIETMTYPSGRQVQYLRDNKGRIATVRTRASTAVPSWVAIMSGVKYESFGALRSANFGNGLKVLNNRGDDGRLDQRRLYRTDGSDVSRLTYGYDADDNITRITDVLDASKNQIFGYDAAGRLSRTTLASGAVRRVNYVHDDNGNRLRAVRRALPDDVAPLETDVYRIADGQNRLTSVTTPAGTRSITYDGRGNTVSETRANGVSVAVAYDAYGRLTGYSRTGEASLSHVYNGLDDRVATTAGGSTRRFVTGPDGRVLGEYGVSAADVKAEFIWTQPDAANDNALFGGGDGVGGYAPLAVAVGDGSGATTLNWVHGNHLGVPLIITDASGSPAAPADYAAPGFPGQSRTLADLYYNRYRDYDPTTGRYIQADPIGLAGDVNPYAYAGGNPVTGMDPDGRLSVLLVPLKNAVDRLIRNWLKPPPPSKQCPIPSEDDRESLCEKAKLDARSRYFNLVNKRIPQYESGGTNGPDAKHYRSIGEMQRALKDAIRRVMLYCGPLPVELVEWQRVANLNIPAIH